MNTKLSLVSRDKPPSCTCELEEVVLPPVRRKKSCPLPIAIFIWLKGLSQDGDGVQCCVRCKRKKISAVVMFFPERRKYFLCLLSPALKVFALFHRAAVELASNHSCPDENCHALPRAQRGRSALGPIHLQNQQSDVDHVLHASSVLIPVGQMNGSFNKIVVNRHQLSIQNCDCYFIYLYYLVANYASCYHTHHIYVNFTTLITTT